MAAILHSCAGDVAFGASLQSSDPRAQHDDVSQAGGATQHRFSPYEWNGGTVVAVAGDDYVVIASDKRLAAGYSIKSRNITRLHRLSVCFAALPLPLPARACRRA